LLLSVHAVYFVINDFGNHAYTKLFEGGYFSVVTWSSRNQADAEKTLILRIKKTRIKKRRLRLLIIAFAHDVQICSSDVIIIVYVIEIVPVRIRRSPRRNASPAPVGLGILCQVVHADAVAPIVL